MNYEVPAYLTPFILTGMILVVSTLVLGLARALRSAAWPVADRTKALANISALLVAWLVVGSPDFDALLDQRGRRGPAVSTARRIPLSA